MPSAKRGERPKSELLFECFCQERGVKFERISVVANVRRIRTPDYMIFPAGERIVVEIGQIDPNKNDCQYPADRRRGKIGQRIRQKMTDKADQLKTRSAGIVPAMLVIYNNTEVRSYTSPEHVRAAMFGFDTYHIAVPDDPFKPNTLVDRKFGRGAQMTTECNTSLSALAVLEEAPAGGLRLRIYHNYHTANPISLPLLNLAGVEQYALEQKIPGAFQDWVRISHG